MESSNVEAVERLRTAFNEMTESRRHLRPILSDIAISIDKGFFLDAGSEEVTILLKKILEAQEQFSEVEQVRRAANSKKVEQVEKAISGLEQNIKRDELNEVLAKIATLEVDSDNSDILDAVKKVKLQAEHLRHKVSKMDITHFSKNAEKFALLAEIIENENFSPQDYIKVVNAFQDNPLISMVLTQKILHFPRPVEVEEPEVEVEEEKIPAPPQAEEESSEVPNKYRIAAVLKKFDKVKPDLILMENDENNFVMEKAQVKKPLTIKSFNKKIHELLESTNPETLFKFLIKTRIFYWPQPKGTDLIKKFPKKLNVMTPTILERLFTWGLADKIQWRERKFYYINEHGMDIFVRMFTHSTFQSDGDYFRTLAASMRYFMIFIAQSRISASYEKIEFFMNDELPATRGALKIKDSNEIQIVWLFSVTLLGKNWTYAFAKFKMLIESDIDSGGEVKAVILFGFTKDDVTWLKMFDTIKFKQVKFFMYTLDGLFTQKGNEIPFNDWEEVCKFGLPSRKRKKSLPQLPEPPDEPAPPPTKPIKLPDKKNSEKLVRKINGKDHVSLKGFIKLFSMKDEEIHDTMPDEWSDEKILRFRDVVKQHFEPTVFLQVYEQFKREYGIDWNAIGGKKKFRTAEIPKPSKLVDKKNVEVKVVDEPEEIPEVEEVEEISVAEEEKQPDILTNTTKLFKAGENSRGMLSLHALRDSFGENDSDGEIWAEHLVREIGFILDDPVTLKNLHNFDTFSFWTGEIEIPAANIGNSFDWLNLAAMLKNFYAPQNPTSYQVQKSWKQLNEDKSNAALKMCPAAKTLLSLFNNFTEKTHRAFADCLTNAEDNNEDKLRQALQQIQYADNMSDSVLRSEINHRRVKDLIQQIFSYSGLMRRWLNVENFGTDEILIFCRDFEETDLNAVIEESGATINDELFSEEKIDDYLDDVWEHPKVNLVGGKNEPFKGPKRKKVLTVVKQILTALLNYVYAKKHIEAAAKSDVQAAPVAKALEILADLKKQVSRTEKRANLGQIIFHTFTDNLEKKLHGENISLSYRECLLGAKYIELENDMPVVNSFGIAEFSLKNRAAEFESEIKYKKLEENLQKAYETALKNYDCGVLQYLAKFYLSQLPTSEEDIKRKLSGLERQVDRQIDRLYNEFLNDLELARNYSRITDQERIEFYINAAVEAKEHFLQTKNAGLFQRFINSCTASINKVSIPQRDALNKRLEKLEENLAPTLGEGETLETRYPILPNVRRQIDLMNLTVAEDYMNRLETEGGNLLTELDVTDSDLGTLADFLAEYEVLLNAVNSANSSVESAFKKRTHHGNKPNRETQNAIDFARGWQGLHSGQNSAIEAAIIDLLSHLGYGGGKISAQNVDSLNQKSYTVTFTEPIKARESYPHPFAVFGTEIYTNGLEVIYLGSNRKFENVAQVLTEMTADRGTICFMDLSLTLPERRNLAKIMKLTPNLKNIIVIDKVMALYLTRFDEANRGKKMLQTALPFARVQPYTAGGFVAPEMFIGRSEELDQIRDMKGPVFVYGGRQLGKSALLRQVKSIEHNPAQLNYAFFIDLKNLDSESTLKKIVYELKNAKLIGEVQTWKEFSFEMHKLLDGQLRGVFKPKKLLLLMDESDTFLSEKDSEQAIDILRELLVAFNGQFKFVLAGLHKVIRFEQNSSFGNLNHISVLPFRPSDAMELLVKPMSYLGFRVVDDSLISAIFSRTNYYPGSIQYYCKMLVDAVGNNYTKQKFDVAKNPPYALDDDYLKNMLGNREFQEEINQKFQITLHLDDDNYYEILALAVAMIYYEHNRPVGVDLTEIKNICLMCGVDKITRLSDAELTSLLDEMVALNLLRRADGKFEFNRYAFWHMMGTESEVNEKLDSYGING